MDFVAIDFESASVKEHFVCAYGIVRVVNGQLERAFKSLVRSPYGKIDWQSTAVHNITENDIVGEDEFPQHWEKIKEIISNYPIIAHNAKSADLTMLKASLDFYGLEYPTNPWLCTLHTAKRNFNLEGGFGLDNIAKIMGYDLVHHDPLEDAKITACFACFLEKELGPDIFMRYLFTPEWQRKNSLEKSIRFDFEKIEKNNSLSGRLICLTGNFDRLSRGELEELVVLLGGTLKNSVTKKTSIVVVGNDVVNGSNTNKYKDAIERSQQDPNFMLLTEEAFFNLFVKKKE